MNLETSFRNMFENVVKEYMDRIEDVIQEIPKHTISHMQGYKELKQSLEQREKEYNEWRQRLDEDDKKMTKKRKHLYDIKADLETREANVKKLKETYQQTNEMKETLQQGIDNIQKKEQWLKYNHPELWEDYQSEMQELTHSINETASKLDDNIDSFSFSLDSTEENDNDKVEFPKVYLSQEEKEVYTFNSPS